MAQELSHRFVVRVREEICTFRRWEDLPPRLDAVIRFEPAIPPPPHTPEQHAEIEVWDARLQELLRRCHAPSHPRR